MRQKVDPGNACLEDFSFRGRFETVWLGRGFGEDRNSTEEIERIGTKIADRAFRGAQKDHLAVYLRAGAEG